MATTESRNTPGVRSWVRWGRRDVPLAEGVNILGRDSVAAVRIDLPEISRRHASIIVGVEHATIEDLGSRNGTFVDDKPVDGPRRIRDGDRIRLGSIALTFHVATDGATTQPVPGRRRQT